MKGRHFFYVPFITLPLFNIMAMCRLILTPTESINDVDVARTPVKQVYEWIITDMKDAESRSENSC